MIKDKENLDFEYCSAKYSDFYYEDGTKLERKFDVPKFAKNSTHYTSNTLEKDSHFYDISVNTSISCIHVPTNIFYQGNITINVNIKYVSAFRCQIYYIL